MPVRSSHFRTPFIEATLAGVALNTAYPPASFQAGTILFVQDSTTTPTPTHYIRVTTNVGAAAWKQLSGAATAGASTNLNTQWFNGTLIGSGGAVTSYLANTTTTSTAQSTLLQYRRDEGSLPIAIKRLRLFVTVNALATDATVTVMRNDVAEASTNTTITAAATGAITGPTVAIALSDNDRLGVRITNTAGTANALTLSAALEFAAV